MLLKFVSQTYPVFLSRVKLQNLVFCCILRRLPIVGAGLSSCIQRRKFLFVLSEGHELHNMKKYQACHFPLRNTVLRRFFSAFVIKASPFRSPAVHFIMGFLTFELGSPRSHWRRMARTAVVLSGIFVVVTFGIALSISIEAGS